MHISFNPKRLFTIGLPAGVLVVLTATAADDLSGLSDEFDHPGTLPNWGRVYQTEGWDFDQLEAWDINTSHVGRMTMMPYTSSWYK